MNGRVAGWTFHARAGNRPAAVAVRYRIFDWMEDP